MAADTDRTPFVRFVDHPFASATRVLATGAHAYSGVGLATLAGYGTPP